MKSRLLALLLLVFIWAPVAAQDLSEGIYRLQIYFQPSNSTPYWAYLKRGETGLFVGQLDSSPEAADWKLVPVAGTANFRIQNPNDPDGFLQLDVRSNAVLGALRSSGGLDSSVWRFTKRPNGPTAYTIGSPEEKYKTHLLSAFYGVKSGVYENDFSKAIWRVTSEAQAARDRANARKPAPGKWIVN